MSTLTENILNLVAIIVIFLLMAHACTAGLDRQIEAEYKQCLAWQADGHPVECNNPIPKKE